MIINSLNRMLTSKCKLRWSAVLFLALYSGASLFAQNVSDIRIGFGLRSQFGGMQAYKDISAFYNSNRTWLDKDLSENGIMNGFEFGLEGEKNDFGFSLFHLYVVGKKSTAKGTNNGIDYERKLKARVWGLETFDINWSPIKIRNTNIGFGAMPLGLGFFRVKTKLNDEDWIKVPLSNLEKVVDFSFIKTMHMYAQIHADVTVKELANLGSVHFQFFYTIGPKQEYELFYLNQQLNPSSYDLLYKRTLLKINNFGIKLLINPN